MKNKNIVIYTLIFFLCAVIALVGFFSISVSTDNDISSATDSELYLKAYENTVALYDGEKIKEIYSDIVLNALPIKDQNTLNSGIPIKSDEQLNSLLEDFDG